MPLSTKYAPQTTESKFFNKSFNLEINSNKISMATIFFI